MKGFTWPDDMDEELQKLQSCCGIWADSENFQESAERIQYLLVSECCYRDFSLNQELYYAQTLLNQQKFDDALQQYKRIVIFDSRCSEAYIGKYMAEHQIKNLSDFEDYYCKNIIYDNIDLQIAKHISDKEPNKFLRKIAFPKCAKHGILATKTCENCGRLLCGGCSTYVKNTIKIKGSEQPWPHGKILCPDCIELMNKHSKSMQKRCYVHLIGGIIIILLAVFAAVLSASGDVHSFFLGLGIINGLYQLIRYGFSVNHGNWGILASTLSGLFIILLVSVFCAPFVLIGAFIKRVYLLIKLIRLQISKVEKTDKGILTNKYFELVKIIRSLGLSEPEV